MQALLKTPANATLRSKIIIQDTCRCQKWKTKHGAVSFSHLVAANKYLYPTEMMSIQAAFIPSIQGKWRRSSGITLSSGRPLLVHECQMTAISGREFSISCIFYDKEPLKPSSKIEESVKAIKEKADSKLKADSKVAEVGQKPKMPLWEKVKHEVLHYYHGFRLLFIDINISRKLLWRILNGKTLSRREHRLLVRTVGDLFRLLPFSVFIIVPFMELLLPFAIKMFPGMLPSTFQSAREKDDKLKQSLKVRLEMAKFLQNTLDDMSVQSKDNSSQATKEFTEFFKKIRSSGEAPSNEEIIKFSTLFEDEIILDSLSRQQLTALCRVLDISPVGTTNLLRFQIRMRLRSLAADDKMILKEGVDSLNVQELQTACQARAMRAYGVSEDKLKSQLSQWLNLSVNEKVPPSLLLLSRALMLPDTIAPTDQLKATISALPDTVELKAKVAIIEREGIVDNKTKIDLIKEEEKQIKEERAEQRQSKELMQDPAPYITDETGILPHSSEISSKDLEALEDALDTLGKEKKKLLVEKEELDDLKEELMDYQEDVKELKEVLATSDTKREMRETKAAKNLFKKVNKMISKMDTVLTELENKGKKIQEIEGTEDPNKQKKKEEELVKIDELMDVIKRIQKIPDDSKLQQISKVLGKIDDDQDGAISVEEVLKVIELIGKEHVELTTKQFDEIIELLDKEETLEIEEQIEKALEKQSPVEKLAVQTTLKDKDKPDVMNSSEKDSSSPHPKAAAISVSPNGTGSKTTIKEPKDLSSDTSKKL
ncbi:UNVERIFIED_CONTAM: hypothetical protein PYX00_007211 [Menopon gallinae]